jgi:hypothetical protein
VIKIELIEGLIKKPLHPQVTQSRSVQPAVSAKRILAANGDLLSV